MLDVAKCFDERQLGGFDGRSDELLEYLVESEQEEIYILATVGLGVTVSFRECIAGGWNLFCILDMGRPFGFTHVGFAIFGLTKKAVKYVKVSNWHGDCGPNGNQKHSRDTAISFNANFTPEYMEYWQKCEAFVNGGKEPKDDFSSEFVSISINNVNPSKLTPTYYSADNRSLRKQISKEDTLPLESLATILVTRPVRGSDQEVPVLQASDLKYPFSIDALKTKTPTTVQLKKGDVVVSAAGKQRIFVFPGGRDVFAGSMMFVIRPNANVSPEYLYLYLTSDLARRVFAALGDGCTFKRLALSDIRSFPIVVPKQEPCFYIEQFKKLTEPATRNYLSINELKTGHVSEVEGILDRELFDRVKAYDIQQLQKLIGPDIRELNICYAHGAYKAAVILAGSVLEAFLIDWLSAIKGVDYFVNKYYVTDKKSGRRREAGLADYINEIKYIEMPKWLDEAEKAHYIRDKRNMVHAKVVVRDGNADKKTTREVIDYLKAIIKTRAELFN